MALPAPDLDDRRFQDLVDDAKRLVQRRCPEWSDHNVSDPGVTLIETFAFMVDQMLYRLNRVPERVYIKFLELIGVQLYPPTAARADVTFWLSAPQEQPIDVPVGTEVATVRTDTDELLNYHVTDDLSIVPCSLERLATTYDGEDIRDQTETIGAPRSFFAFDQVPKADDTMFVGLSNPVPSCAVLLRFDCEIEGVGVDPLNPPLVWEAWTGERWEPCEVDRDGTGGLNRAGDVVVHVPGGHVASLIDRQRAGWLRCRVVEAEEGQPQYSAPPKINSCEAMTIGGTVGVVNAQVITDEILGLSEGVSGQSFALKHAPVIPGDEPLVVEVAAGSGWAEWTAVESFADSGPSDRHFQLVASSGEVRFGPSVREPDGSLRQYGAIPPKGAPLRVREYRTGGGRNGNVARGSIVVLKTTIPFIASVSNRHAAYGGVDGETLEAAKDRGPILLRTRSRAVTAEDYEQIAKEAAPEVARVRCVAAGEGEDATGARVLVVPHCPVGDLNEIAFEQLLPADGTLQRISEHLDSRRVIGARIVVEPPVYQGITVVARLRARPRVSSKRLQRDALAALNAYFSPLSGGPEGGGWPFGRAIHVGEIYSVLQRLRGTEFVEDARLFGADPITGERGEAAQRIEIGPNALVFSYEHKVMVEEA